MQGKPNEGAKFDVLNFIASTDTSDKFNAAYNAVRGTEEPVINVSNGSVFRWGINFFVEQVGLCGLEIVANAVPGGEYVSPFISTLREGMLYYRIGIGAVDAIVSRTDEQSLLNTSMRAVGYVAGESVELGKKHLTKENAMNVVHATPKKVRETKQNLEEKRDLLVDAVSPYVVKSGKWFDDNVVFRVRGKRLEQSTLQSYTSAMRWGIGVHLEYLAIAFFAEILDQIPGVRYAAPTVRIVGNLFYGFRLIEGANRIKPEATVLLTNAANDTRAVVQQVVDATPKKLAQAGTKLKSTFDSASAVASQKAGRLKTQAIQTYDSVVKASSQYAKQGDKLLQKTVIRISGKQVDPSNIQMFYSTMRWLARAGIEYGVLNVAASVLDYVPVLNYFTPAIRTGSNLLLGYRVVTGVNQMYQNVAHASNSSNASGADKKDKKKPTSARRLNFGDDPKDPIVEITQKDKTDSLPTFQNPEYSTYLNKFFTIIDDQISAEREGSDKQDHLKLIKVTLIEVMNKGLEKARTLKAKPNENLTEDQKKLKCIHDALKEKVIEFQKDPKNNTFDTRQFFMSLLGALFVMSTLFLVLISKDFKKTFFNNSQGYMLWKSEKALEDTPPAVIAAAMPVA